MESPTGSSDRIGKWAVYGIARGYQKGKEGKSYGIVTVTAPGEQRSISLDQISLQLTELKDFARQHPELEFLCCIKGGGYSGWSQEEIQKVYTHWTQKEDFPINILILREYI